MNPTDYIKETPNPQTGLIHRTLTPLLTNPTLLTQTTTQLTQTLQKHHTTHLISLHAHAYALTTHLAKNLNLPHHQIHITPPNQTLTLPHTLPPNSHPTLITDIITDPTLIQTATNLITAAGATPNLILAIATLSSTTPHPTIPTHTLLTL